MIDPDTGRVVYVLDCSKGWAYDSVSAASMSSGVTEEVIISDCDVPLNHILPTEYPRFIITTAIPA